MNSCQYYINIYIYIILHYEQENMEYLEGTVEKFVFDILICCKWLISLKSYLQTPWYASLYCEAMGNLCVCNSSLLAVKFATGRGITISAL